MNAIHTTIISTNTITAIIDIFFSHEWTSKLRRIYSPTSSPERPPAKCAVYPIYKQIYTFKNFKGKTITKSTDWSG